MLRRCGPAHVAHDPEALPFATSAPGRPINTIDGGGNMRFHPRLSIPVLAAVTALFPLGALAQSPHRPVAQMVTTATTVEWQQAAGDHTAVVLSVQRPDGQIVSETFAAGSKPMVHVENLSDGLYSYELRGDAGVQSGSFAVRNGAVVPANLRENAFRSPLKPSTETFFGDFVSAVGGLCGGADCTSSETFPGFAVIKAKANNVRLKFEDTSTLAGFASTDWQ